MPYIVKGKGGSKRKNIFGYSKEILVNMMIVMITKKVFKDDDIVCIISLDGVRLIQLQQEKWPFACFSKCYRNNYLG